MNIIICGAGEVGRHSAEVLAPDGHNVTLIDRDPAKLAECESLIDIGAMEGDATRAEVLRRAGVAEADLFIAATSIDEINLLSASIASALGCDQTIARVHHASYFESQGLDYGKHFGIDHLVCPEHTTAVAVATTLRSPGAQEVENFARGSIELQRLPVGEGSKATRAKLSELPLPSCSLVVAVERGEEAFRPNADTELIAGDVVTAIGDESSLVKLFKVFGVETPRRLKVMLVGGTNQGVWLCRELRAKQFQVRLFESDPARAAALSERLPWVTVLTGDIIASEVLLDERVDQADAFIACTEDDETNILIAARAKTMGVKSAVCVLQRSVYTHLLSHIGIDLVFSPRATAVGEILRRLETHSMRHLATLADGVAEVYETRLNKADAAVIGVPLSRLNLPEQALVALVQRGAKTFIPAAAEQLALGDTVVVVAPSRARKPLRKALLGH
ncbi:Trk system potassium transporter TrkA [Phycisphaera mikurensis]|uniref:Trk system potassium transporter TrkA n=1 Tax=Phycisphaera mikurensis TaxID=547188 RepID=UPI000A01B22B|nr:Trk system potassium transporter TrkA [Phycisphaera mikurensis]